MKRSEPRNNIRQFPTKTQDAFLLSLRVLKKSNGHFKIVLSEIVGNYLGS